MALGLSPKYRGLVLSQQIHDDIMVLRCQIAVKLFHSLSASGINALVCKLYITYLALHK